MRPKSIGDQELALLQYVGEQEGATVGQAAEGFGAPRGLARSTVLTMMERLRQKGHLERRQVDGVYQYFSPAAPGQFGTCGNGTLYGPGLRNLDLGLQKNFLLTERYRFEFRSEFINLTNTPTFNAPDTGVGPNMGRITSTQGARQIQFALKFYF